MSEEVKIKISQPMFEAGELERFDNYIHSIVEEYSKLIFKEKYQILTQRIIMKQEQEIERLKEEYVMLQNASDEVEEKKDREIERLNNKIDKAIEYIDKHSLFEFNGNSVRDNRARMDLLNILRGEDKE